MDIQKIREDIRRRALIGDASILDEYHESILEEEIDEYGWNAYHILAQGRKVGVLKFTGAYKLRNKSGETAIDILLKNFDIDREVLEKFFPWYSPQSESETIEESLKAIRDTSSAEKWILSI